MNYGKGRDRDARRSYRMRQYRDVAELCFDKDDRRHYRRLFNKMVARESMGFKKLTLADCGLQRTTANE